jgi:FMN-dependent NADH-azoreductase
LRFFIDCLNRLMASRYLTGVAMNTLLQINTSLSGENGESSQLAKRLVQSWQAQNPRGRTLVRDLAMDPVPHLTGERFQALLSKPEGRTLEQQAVVAYSDELIDELRSADVIVLAAPMYNFSVPSTLRAYLDHVARAGETFRYTANGPEGLLKGKKAYVVVTRGGVYPEAADTQTPYLRQILGFMGITDVEFIHAEGLAMGEEPRQKGLDTARHTISKLVPALQAA